MTAAAHSATSARARRRRVVSDGLAEQAFRIARAQGIDPGGFRLDADGGITVLDKSVIATSRAPADEFEALEREGRL